MDEKVPRQRNTLKHLLLAPPPPLHSSVTCHCLSDRVAANPGLKYILHRFPLHQGNIK